jgi:thioredoxin-like negative regulator of GroEL
VDVDTVNELTIEYDIEKLPTFVVFKGGKRVDRSEGPNKKALEALIKKHI